MLDQTYDQTFDRADRPAGAAPARPAAPTRMLDRSEADRYAAAAARLKREHDFKLFRKNAAWWFAHPPKTAGGADDAHARMRARCGYAVSLDGGRLGGADAASVVEVFYGDRPLANYENLASPSAREAWGGATETGAALLYSQGVDGVVRVFLYPAATARRRPEEDAIELGRYADLEIMTGEGILERHWRAFRAYAEVTSLDGEPTPGDRLLVAWLRAVRPSLRDGRKHAPRIFDLGLGVGLVAMAIALGASLTKALG